MGWEVDWNHADNTGSRVMARKPDGHLPKSREWHLVSTATLRRAGINTPIYRADAWEVDWSRRDGDKVWARNPMSKMPDAREWHWVDYKTLSRAGVAWRPLSEKTGRYINKQGYAILSRRAMIESDIAIATEHNLFRGTRKQYVAAHRLEAVKKFGSLPPDTVVRHVNGIKTDNSPDNLVLGTTQENTMDHNTARLMAMYWRNKYEEALAEIERLRASIPRGE